MKKVKQKVKQTESWRCSSGGEQGRIEVKNKWQRVDSNRRPRAYESPALPLSYAANRVEYSINGFQMSISTDDVDSGGFERRVDLFPLG